MKLRFRQRFFSWFDSYDIYDEANRKVYTVRGQLSWGHRLKIFDAAGREVGMVQERVLALLPKFEMYLGRKYIGCISREMTLLKPRYKVECNGWRVEGDVFEWNYRILNRSGQIVARVSKELLRWTDTYAIEVSDPQDAIYALMLVLAIDAEKCTRGDG